MSDGQTKRHDVEDFPRAVAAFQRIEQIARAARIALSGQERVVLDALPGDEGCCMVSRYLLTARLAADALELLTGEALASAEAFRNVPDKWGGAP